MVDSIKLSNQENIAESEIFNMFNIWSAWIVSDTHFNHYPKTWEWPGRKTGWENKIYSNWNGRVNPNDIVLHLGDFSFGNKENISEVREKLNGDIFLIKGNHDRHGYKWYKDIGITLIKKSFYISSTDEKFVFSHRPVKNPGDLNIHGHIHEKGYYLSKNYVNVSVEQTDFTPVKFRDLIYNWRLHNFRNEV